MDEERKERKISEDLDKKKTDLQKEKQEFVLKKEQERRNMKAKLVVESHREIEAEVAKKEKMIRSRLANEFDLNLKKKIQEHEVKLKKRKLELELQMQNKIKQILN